MGRAVSYNHSNTNSHTVGTDRRPPMDLTPTRWNAAAHALAECRKVDEVKGWVDKAAALAEYARQAKDRHLELDAGEIRIRAERRLGQLLAETERHKGGNPALTTPSHREGVESEPQPKKLSEEGIGYKLSSRAQKLAAVPEPEFEEAVSEWRAEAEQAHGRVVARLESAGEAKLAEGGGKDASRDAGPPPAQEKASNGEDESDLRDLVRELTLQVQTLTEDNESMARVFEGTDQVAAAMKESARYREMARVLDSRVKGLQSELHEAQKSANYWRKKYEKAVK